MLLHLIRCKVLFGWVKYIYIYTSYIYIYTSYILGGLRLPPRFDNDVDVSTPEHHHATNIHVKIALVKRQAIALIIAP